MSQSLCNKRTSCLLLGITYCITLYISVYSDNNDRDLSCIVSSLVQIMCDTHYRTISGFESLVQKEWIAMGHPFTTRSGLVTDPTNEEMDDGQVIWLL